MDLNGLTKGSDPLDTGDAEVSEDPCAGAAFNQGSASETSYPMPKDESDLLEISLIN